MSAQSLAHVSGKSTLTTARFAPGMLLQHDDLQSLADFPRQLSRLLFRSLFGCGVVCGLVVKVSLQCGKLQIKVHAGVALGCNGDPIQVPSDATLSADLGGNDKLTELWVLLCAKTRRASPRITTCASDDEDAASVCTRAMDWFEIRVVEKLPSCVCPCDVVEKPADPTGKPDGPDTTDGSGGTDTTGTPTSSTTVYLEATSDNTCWCVKPDSPHYKDHYGGVCEACGCSHDCDCGCECDCGCSCNCVVLAKLTPTKDDWEADHSFRRFVRPVLMRDPQVQAELEAKQKALAAKSARGSGKKLSGKPSAPAAQIAVK